MTVLTTCKVALKEWAVAVRELAAGRQVVLLRKGGIREPGKEFRVVHPEFLLFPTYEHQREELIKPEYHASLRQLLAEAPRSDTVTMAYLARVAEAIEVTDQRQVDALAPHHLWTNDYAQKRLHWKPRKPLHVLLVRLYRLERPHRVPVLPEYAGCTSWVELAEPVPLGALTPVLDDEAFQRRAQAAKAALASVGVEA